MRLKHIYYLIALVALYGDLLKHVMAPLNALMMIYGLAAIIPIVMTLRAKSTKMFISPEGKTVYILVIALVFLYIFQFLISFSAPFKEGITHVIYVCIPLIYIIVILKYYPEFDLVHLGRIILLLMLPINIVGLVQYFIDPNFMISTNYSGDYGGVIIRNYLMGFETYSRYPSIFASADRYSAMGLMQLFFTMVVINGSQNHALKSKYWIIFNLISACFALLIAGARSRILIALIAVIFIVIALTYGILFSRTGSVKKILKHYLPVLSSGIILFVLSIFAVLLSQQDKDEFSFPVLSMLAQSVEQGDISFRVDQAASLSLMQDETTLFGRGLGTVGNGKPGEFGIRSIWIESGVFWGTLMILAYFGIILAILSLALRCLLASLPMCVGIYAIPILVLSLSILAGLSVSFELSTGILLCCSIAVIVRQPDPIMGKARWQAVRKNR